MDRLKVKRGGSFVRLGTLTWLHKVHMYIAFPVLCESAVCVGIWHKRERKLRGGTSGACCDFC